MNQSTKADQIVPANAARQTANDETSGQTPENISLCSGGSDAAPVS